MKNFNFVVTIIISIIAASCSYSNPANNLLWLDEANPAEDFQIAVSQSDYRFAGVYGEGLDVPAVPWDCIDYKKDVKIIDWSTDVIEGDEHLRLKRLAYEYAELFNGRMLKYLEENHDFKCET